MKNIINYYYNLNPVKINHVFDYYYFYVDSELYYFRIYNKDINDVMDIYQFNREMINKDIMVSEIINNRDNEILTYVKHIPYILTKILININKPINLGEISYLSNIKILYNDRLMRGNWIDLWSNKIDYLEYYHEHNYQKYPIINDSFNYFIGLSENAISYLKDTVYRYNPDSSDVGVISHDRIIIDDTVFSLYDSLNIIIDHKARDLGEYIKISFFNDNYAIFDELDEYFKYNYFSIYGIHLLLSRVLYPSFYFEVYDDIIMGKYNESVILKITSRIDEYEEYLRDIWNYFHKYYPIKDIEWLRKK